MAHGVVENESIQVSTNGQDMIARRYLSVPASEFGVERRGRDLLGLRRYALQPATIRMLNVLKAFQCNKHWLVIPDLREEAVDPDIDIEVALISK